MEDRRCHGESADRTDNLRMYKFKTRPHTRAADDRQAPGEHGQGGHRVRTRVNKLEEVES